MLTRDEAFELLTRHVPDAQLITHSLESEAVLAALARRLGQDEALWGLAGLLHDLDYATTKDPRPPRAGPPTCWPAAAGGGLTAIRAHNGGTRAWLRQRLDFALRAAGCHRAHPHRSGAPGA
jgi:hypothetical protein